MKSVAPPPASADDEIFRLTALLQKTGQRLEVLTGGEVDSVVDRTGRIFLLKGVQAQLRRAEDSRQAAILNALPAHIALLDARGVIISMNGAWREFTGAHVLQGPGHAVGRNYLEICDGARGDDSAEARQAAKGMQAVLDRREKSFSMEYPCHSPAQQRWFLMTVTPLADDRKSGAVVMHVDITDRKRGEQELQAFCAAMDALADAIYLVDRSSMRFVHVNDTACRMMNKTQAELMALKPWEILSISRAELEHTYDTLIASGVEAVPLEMRRSRAGGAQVWVELRRHALRSGDRWTIVTLVRDVTERKQAEQQLHDSEARFRSLTMLSSDWFWEQDAEHRFVAFSGGEGVEGWGPDQNKAVGLHRWDLGGVVPISCTWQEHRRTLDAHKPFRKFEYQRILGDGRLQYVEASGEPLFDAGGAFTGYRGVATEITQRKEAEIRIRRLNRVYAVLSGINTLIVRVRDRDELFRQACRIAVEEGGFHLAWIGILDQAATQIVPVTSAGTDERLMTIVKELFSSSAGAPQGNTLAARAMRKKMVLTSNDSQNDPKVIYGHQHAVAGVRSMAMLPLVVSGASSGVLALYSKEIGYFDAEEIKLLSELAGDIAFAIEHIEKAGRLARTTRVNAMLSGINGAIVRIRGRQELCEEACRIAVETGALPFAWLGVVDAFETHLQLVASAGRDDGFLQTIRDRLAQRGETPESQSLSWRAIRERRAVVVNDVAADTVLRSRKAFADRGISAVAVFPLFIADRVAGAFALHSEQAGFFDDDEMRLLNEVAANIAFALEHIEKEEKVRRLTRVYAVLSGINTLIVRTRDREELFREVCRIAVEVGQFAKAWLGTVDPVSKQFTMLAAHGGDPQFFESLARELAAKIREGRGLVVRAIETGHPVIVNDTANDLEVLLKSDVTAGGVRSLAILPLTVSDEVVVVFALNADVVGYFDDEEMKLLVELAGDIGFALDHIGKEAKLDYLAYYDVLTGLANRGLFLERVAQYVRSAASGAHKLAVFLIDLERFKNINDSLGRPAGDELLKQVAAWLTHSAGDANLLARVDADHFALVLPKIRADGSVTRLVEKIMAAFMAHSFKLDDAVLRVALKAGIALFPDDGADADTLFRNAEAALKKAKQQGERYLFYQQKMNAAAAGKLTLENQLRQALENNEFVLHYQPKVSLENSALTSAEALIRWNDPRTGLVPPGRFIPVLEETGLIYDVGRWALRKAIEDYLRWRAAGLPAVRIAVNVSPLQLRNRGFIDEIRQVVGTDAAAAAGLELEITESLIMEDVKNSIASLKAIREMDVTIAIDDFGTGFSSLSYLAKLPVDTLKIDRSFVIDMTAGPEGLALVSAIINLAHSLKLKVVAEGVETEEQSRLLRLLRCNEMQGFLFSKPVPAEIFEAKFLAANIEPQPKS